MNTPFFIAKRYLFSKKTHNVINIISGISVFGIMVSTAALVIVLSAFNGIESLVISIFSEFEADIKITSSKTKSFDPKYVPDAVYQNEGIINYTHVIEEIAIIKNYEQFIIGKVKGVEPTYLEMCEMDEHMIDGEMALEDQYGPLGLIGINALQQLDGFIYQVGGQLENFTIYAPNKNERIRRNNLEAFTTAQIPIIGTFSFNNKVDEEYLVVPLSYAADIFDYDNLVTGIEIKYEEGTDLIEKKKELATICGDSFEVESALERNQLIYQTSQSERWITVLLLSFIFFLSTFNMIASITMLIIEKQQNLKTLYAMGARKNQLEKIFFFEGLLINGLGMIFGLVLGYLICYLQIQFGFVSMEGGMVESYPISFKFTDLLLILTISIIFGTLSAYLPSKFLVKRTLNN